MPSTKIPGIFFLEVWITSGYETTMKVASQQHFFSSKTINYTDEKQKK